MRYPPAEEYEQKELKRLRAPSWMVSALGANPGYLNWGPHEDYMWNEKGGWDSRVIVERFSERFELDDYNEIVNYYFEINRNSEECSHCGATGKNLEVAELNRSFYDFEKVGNRWNADITQDEADALWDEGRLRTRFKKKPTAQQVNEMERNGSGLCGHDAINRWILIEARAKRMGVWTDCPHCDASGYVFTEIEPRLSLILWVLHPRKGCSRGMEIKHIEQDELPAVVEYLREAERRNTARFSGLANL